MAQRVVDDFRNTAELMHSLDEWIVWRAVVEGLQRELLVIVKTPLII